MITYIELWKAAQAWTDLSKEERGNYISALGPAIQSLLESGVKVISWGINHDNTYSKAEYDYFAVWEFPDVAAAQAFEQLVLGSGWYNYFTQVNAMGDTTDPQTVLQHLIER